MVRVNYLADEFTIDFHDIDDRGYSLSQNKYNFGYFKSSNILLESLLNSWVDQQRIYILNLDLETQSAILLFQSYSSLFETQDIQDTLMSSNKNLRQLFESLPSSDQLSRYFNLLIQALDNCPVLPVDLYIKKLDNNRYIQHLTFGSDTIILKGSKILYFDAMFEIQQSLIYLAQDLNIPKIQPLDNDTVLYLNARKETIEEIGLDIKKFKDIESIIDYPLYDQTEYDNSYLIVPKAHGIVGSGSLIYCQEDQTILLFKRSFGGDAGGMWAGAGGAIGEARTVVYKSKFFFRTYVYNIKKTDKVLLEALDLPRLNYEHTTFEWHCLKSILNQIPNQEFSVSSFIRTYESQIPSVVSKIPSLKNKFGLYVHNSSSKLYELILPGTSYVLCKLAKYLNIN